MSPRRLILGSFLALSLGVATERTWAGEPPRHHRDEAEQRDLAAEHPKAAELLGNAEAAFHAGKLREAEALLAEADRAAPASFIVARRYCQVLTELGERARAVDACNRALKGGHMAMDRLAAVSALMTGPGEPTSNELAQALLLATTAKNLTGQPFGDAALCEIAYRLGDAVLLQDCTTELARVAPGHYLTRRFQGLLDSGARYWLVWGMLALACLATALHALRGRLTLRRRVAVIASASVVAASLLATPARAEEPGPAASAAPSPMKKKDGHWQLSRFPIDHEHPENAIPTEDERNKEPLDFGYFLQDLASEGAYAEKKGDYRAAVKYWRALAKAVPDVATGFRRACRAYETLEDRDNGLDYCGRALNAQGAELEDYVHYGNLMLMKSEPLDAAELGDFRNTIQHLRAQPGDGARYVAETLSCELAVNREDQGALNQCTQSLEKMKPGDPQTLAFEWSLAMFRHDYSAARELVARLRAGGYEARVVAGMERALAAESRWWKPFTNDWRYWLVSGGGGLGLLAWLLSRRRPPVRATAPAQ
jgi:hypothetical protein